MEGGGWELVPQTPDDSHLGRWGVVSGRGPGDEWEGGGLVSGLCGPGRSRHCTRPVEKWEHGSSWRGACGQALPCERTHIGPFRSCSSCPAPQGSTDPLSLAEPEEGPLPSAFLGTHFSDQETKAKEGQGPWPLVTRLPREEAGDGPWHP